MLNSSTTFNIDFNSSTKDFVENNFFMPSTGLILLPLKLNPFGEKWTPPPTQNWVIIDVINREYCKKLIIQLPRQKHPYHFHKKKEETFQILHGDLEIQKNGDPTYLKEGDIFLVEPGAWHKFSTLDGVIFEEISTTHYNNDSFYQDEYIHNLPREKRKSVVEHLEL